MVATASQKTAFMYVHTLHGDIGYECSKNRLCVRTYVWLSGIYIVLAMNMAWYLFRFIDTITKSVVILFTLLHAIKHHFIKAPCYSWPYYVQYNTPGIIGYCNSTVKTVRVHDWYWFNFYFCEMKTNNVNYVLFSIDLW